MVGVYDMAGAGSESEFGEIDENWGKGKLHDYQSFFDLRLESRQAPVTRSSNRAVVETL